MLTHTYTYEQIHTCTHKHTHAHIHMHMHTQAHRQEVWQGGASINRTAGLLGKGGGGASHMKAGVGGGFPLSNQASNEGDRPTPLATGLHTHMATCTYTHMHSHTQCTHINTLAHVCMCIIHVCMCMHTCTHTFTHTQKYCWTANTL